MGKKYKIAFLIPTYNRQTELNRLLESIEIQSIVPQVIVVIDATAKANDELNKKDGKLNIQYIHAPGTSLTRARNIGIESLGWECELICFLDDDIVFHPGAVEKMMNYWEQAPQEVGGAVFNVVSDKPPSGLVFLKQIFCMGKKERGLVLRSGWNTLICPSKETKYVQWLFGGATVWRRQIFDEFNFDEWYEGYGYVEDMDFSYRVGKKYKLAVVSEAQVDHLHYIWKRSFSIEHGKKLILALHHFICKDNYFSQKLFYLSIIGSILENILRGIITLNKSHFALAIGYFNGLLNIVLDKNSCER